MAGSGGVTMAVTPEQRDGFYRVSVAPGQSLLVVSADQSLVPASPVKSPGAMTNIFGYNSRFAAIIKTFR